MHVLARWLDDATGPEPIHRVVVEPQEHVGTTKVAAAKMSLANLIVEVVTPLRPKLSRPRPSTARRRDRLLMLHGVLRRGRTRARAPRSRRGGGLAARKFVVIRSAASAVTRALAFVVVLSMLRRYHFWGRPSPRFHAPLSEGGDPDDAHMLGRPESARVGVLRRREEERGHVIHRASKPRDRHSSPRGNNIAAMRGVISLFTGEHVASVDGDDHLDTRRRTIPQMKLVGLPLLSRQIELPAVLEGRETRSVCASGVNLNDPLANLRGVGWPRRARMGGRAGHPYQASRRGKTGKKPSSPSLTGPPRRLLGKNRWMGSVRMHDFVLASSQRLGGPCDLERRAPPCAYTLSQEVLAPLSARGSSCKTFDINGEDD